MKVIRYSIFLLLLVPSITFADVVLHLLPESGIYSVGDTFTVQVLLDTNTKTINAAEANLTFNPSDLSVQNITVDGSRMNSWPTTPVFNNDAGTVDFSGWANVHFADNDALLVTITFKALNPAVSNFRFISGAVLADDGGETNVLTSMHSGVYTLQPQEVVALPQIPAPVPDDAPSSTPAAAPTPSTEPPAFIEYPSDVNIDERIVAKGFSIPDSKVFVSLQRQGGDALESAITSGSDGSFTFASETGLQEGVYSLWAQVQGAGGERSSPSRIITVTAHSSPPSASAQVAAAVISNSPPYLSLLALLVIAYLYHRRKLEKMRLENSIKDN